MNHRSFYPFIAAFKLQSPQDELVPVGSPFVATSLPQFLFLWVNGGKKLTSLTCYQKLK